MRTHIIRRQFLEVEFQGTESEGFALQERLLLLAQEWLNPALADLFDRWAPPSKHWIIDRLEIDAGSFSREGLERGLVEAVTRGIEQYLRERAPDAPVSGRQGLNPSTWAPGASIGSPGVAQRRTEGEYLGRAFLEFLKTGSLPWWFELPDGKTLEDLIREVWQAGADASNHPEHFARAVAEEIEYPSVRQRLLRQFSPDFLETLLTGVSREAAAAMREVLAELGWNNIGAQTFSRLAGELWEAAFAMALAREKTTAESLIASWLGAAPSDSAPRDSQLLERIRQLWPEGSLDRADQKPALASDRRRGQELQNRREEDFGLDLEEGIFVRSAGLVLLHPFLPQLFKALSVASSGKLLQPDRALCLLHFLATGHDGAPEYDLPLSKVLCNVPLEAPVHSRVELIETEKAEAVALLEAVIRHWDALGETSVDGLRGSFLVRPGKLSRRGTDDVLQVEPRSYDILLDRLPWGVGLIQLPWMVKTLWVEWRF